ncbi:Scube1, partial [Symbiodinium natans]
MPWQRGLGDGSSYGSYGGSSYGSYGGSSYGYGGSGSYDYSYGYSYSNYAYGGGQGGEAPEGCNGGLCCIRAVKLYPREPYYTNEECVINVADGNSKPLRVLDFETDDGDVLTVNGVNYSGYNGPVGVVPQGPITWSTDSVQGRDMRGFFICLDEEAPTNVTE